MKTAIILIILMLFAIPAATASTKYYKTQDDPTFKTKIITSPAKVSSKPGYIPAFKDKERHFIPRRYTSAEQAIPTAKAASFGEKGTYLAGPRVNVASVSKLASVKPKYEKKTDLPTQSSVKTIGTFGGKLTSSTAFKKNT